MKKKLTNSWECRSLSCRSSKTGTVSRWQRPVTGLDLRFRRDPLSHLSLSSYSGSHQQTVRHHHKPANFEPMNRRLSRYFLQQCVTQNCAHSRAKHLLTQLNYFVFFFSFLNQDLIQYPERKARNWCDPCHNSISHETKSAGCLGLRIIDQ